MSLPMMIHRNRTVLLFDLLLMMLFRFDYLVLLAVLHWKQCYCKHTVLSTFESKELQFRSRTSTVKTLHIRSHLVDAKHGSLAKELLRSTMSLLILLNDTLLFCHMNFFVDNNECIMSSDSNARYKPPSGQQIGDYCSQLT